MTLQPLSVAMLAALALPAIASADPSAGTLDRVVVTANRVAVPVREVIAPVEVIDREEILRSQARSLPDLLRGRAGISIGNQGGLGKLTTLFMRGSESDHVLVLVDGVRMGSATSGLVAFQDIPVELIERIEIVRGPRSSLYGSEAIGGVIQIFTRRDSGAVTPRFAVGAGSHDTYEASAGIGGRVGRGWFGADASRQQSRGINSCRGAGAPVFAGCFTDEPDRDGYERDSVSLRGGAELADGWTADANFLRANGHNEYDGYYNRSKVVQQVAGAGITWSPSQAASLRLQAGRNRDASDNYSGPAYAGNFDTDRDTASLQGDFLLAAAHRLSAGLEWQRDRVESTTSYLVKRRIDRAAFVQYQGDFGAFDLQASARRDDNEQFGGHTTGNLALGFELAADWRLSVGGGTAFKAPTFNELYYPFGSGNPDLGPETSRTVEAGIAWTPGDAVVRLDAYRTHVDDLIAYDSRTRRPENIQQARLQGAELSAATAVSGWDVNATLSLVDAENRSAGIEYGNDLPRRARHSARIDLDRDLGVWRLGLTAAGEGPRHDDVANAVRVGGHATLDLRASFELSRDWLLQARVANLFDRDYETVAWYNQPGRTWFLTLRYSPRGS